MHFQTKRDLSILHQHTKKHVCNAQILNYDMQIVDSFPKVQLPNTLIVKTATLIREDNLFLL